jgi:hypothetical protein
MDHKDGLAIWCPRCKAVVDYACLCPDGNPKFPLVTREEALAPKNKVWGPAMQTAEEYFLSRHPGALRKSTTGKE